MVSSSRCEAADEDEATLALEDVELLSKDH